MAFDGVGYRDAPLGYPVLYHPKAPLIGRCYGAALRMAYCYAINHGRRIIDQHYPINFRSPEGWADGSIIFDTNYVRIAEGFRYIPDLVTHLVAEIIFRVGAHGAATSSDQPTAYNRLVVTDGSGTDTGPVTETRLAISRRRTGNHGPYSPYSAHGTNRYVVRCDVALSAVAAGAVREVYVEGYALRGTALAAVFEPQWIGVWTEIR